MRAQTTLTVSEYPNRSTLYMALELSDSKWKLAFTDGVNHIRVVSIDAGALTDLDEQIGKARKRLGLLPSATVRCCYEAGRYGFWLHRALSEMGFDKLVVDSASIEVNRRYRRAKTDRLDAEKLVMMLVRYHRGEQRVWSVVRVPEESAEDLRQLHRELEQLTREALAHRSRIANLLLAQGVRLRVTRGFSLALAAARLWDGRPLPAQLLERVRREHERLLAVEEQRRALRTQRQQMLRAAKTPALTTVNHLMTLRGIGIEGSWILTMEMFGWRRFDNGKQLGGAAGLTPTPYSSGTMLREQGINKAGNRRVRWLMVQLAWCWLRFQPDSALSRWYQERFSASGRERRKGIVALARKLLVALWRFVEVGVVPEGAQLRPTSEASAS